MHAVIPSSVTAHRRWWAFVVFLASILAPTVWAIALWLWLQPVGVVVAGTAAGAATLAAVVWLWLRPWATGACELLIALLAAGALRAWSGWLWGDANWAAAGWPIAWLVTMGVAWWVRGWARNWLPLVHGPESR